VESTAGVPYGYEMSVICSGKGTIVHYGQFLSKISYFTMTL
jgi:hypothetical protein